MPHKSLASSPALKGGASARQVLGESDNWPIPEQPGESCYDWQPPAPPTLHLNDKDLIWLKSIHITEKK